MFNRGESRGREGGGGEGRSKWYNDPSVKQGDPVGSLGGRQCQQGMHFTALSPLPSVQITLFF